MKLHGVPLERAAIQERSGDLSTFGGVRLVELADGLERGIRTLEFRTGSGLSFDVLVDRAMDFGAAEHSGRSFGWRSPTGFRHPALHEYAGDDGLAFLRSFSGLCVTAGLDHTLFKAEVDSESYAYPHRGRISHALHGRVGNIPAKLLRYGEEWDDSGLRLFAEGEVRQAAVFAETLTLRRRIETYVGSDRFKVVDTVTNDGFQLTPHMYLYHINIGAPLIAPGTRFVAPIASTPWISESGRSAVSPYHTMSEPIDGYVEQVYEHTLVADQAGRHRVALINDNLAFGVQLDWSAEAFPHFFQWVNMRKGGYAVGLEPSTHHVAGDQAARDDGSMIWLEAGESRTYEAVYTVLTSQEACSMAQANIEMAGTMPSTPVP